MATVKGTYTTGQASIPPLWFSSSTPPLALTDHHGHPIILSIGQDAVLRMFRRGPDMAWAVTDLSSLLNLAAGETITACAANQASDLTTFIVIAIGSYTSQPVGRVVVFKPFKPQDVLAFTHDVVQDMIIVPTKPVTRLVCIVRLGPKQLEDAYATVFIAYTTYEEMKTADDVARIQVADDLSSWSCRQDLRLPLKATEILDICPGTVLEEDGIFVLYHIVDTEAPMLLFTAYTTKQYSSILCAPSSTSINSIQTPDGDCDLLIGADGVYRVSAEVLGEKGARGTQLLSETPMIKTFSVMAKQDPKQSIWTVWAVTSEGGLICFDIPSKDVQNALHPVRVTGSDESDMLCGFWGADKERPCFLVVTLVGYARLVEPARGSCLYTGHLLHLPPLNLAPDASSGIYECQIAVQKLEEGASTFSGFIIHLQASSTTAAIIQGEPGLLTFKGSLFGTDENGLLRILIPKTSLRLRVLKVMDETGASLLSAPIIPITLPD